MKYISQFLLFKVFRWKVKGNFPAEIKKYVIIAAPHTHWIDFPLAILVKWATGLKANYIGKASLFKPPFGFIFRALGGAPVDRSKKGNKVEAIIDVFNSHEEFVLGLSPEGTRKKVTTWKTGFYFIAKGANVPIVMTTLNFKDKELKIAEPFYLTDNMEDDMKKIRSYFKGIVGKIPEYS